MTGYAIPYAAAIAPASQPDIEEGQEYQLVIRQQPRRTRAANGTREKDRRPVDPPPIIQFNIATELDRARNFLHNPYYFMCCSLLHETEDKQEPAEYLCGTTVSSQHRLKDLENRDGAFFVFGDLSVKPAGRFRLQFSLFEIRKDAMGGIDTWVHCRTVNSEPFESLPSKEWPGMEESTPLSRSFSDQGVRLRIRKESRSVLTKRIISEMQAYSNPHAAAASGYDYAPENPLKRQRTGFSGPTTTMSPSSYGPPRTSREYVVGPGQQPMYMWDDGTRMRYEQSASRPPNPYLTYNAAEVPSLAQPHYAYPGQREGDVYEERQGQRQLPYPSMSQNPRNHPGAINSNAQLPPLQRPSYQVPPLPQQNQFSSTLPRQTHFQQQDYNPQPYSSYHPRQYTSHERQQYGSDNPQQYDQRAQERQYDLERRYSPQQQPPYAPSQQQYDGAPHAESSGPPSRTHDDDRASMPYEQRRPSPGPDYAQNMRQQLPPGELDPDSDSDSVVTRVNRQVERLRERKNARDKKKEMSDSAPPPAKKKRERKPRKKVKRSVSPLPPDKDKRYWPAQLAEDTPELTWCAPTVQKDSKE